MSWMKKLKLNEAFHGCPMLQVGATGINQPTKPLIKHYTLKTAVTQIPVSHHFPACTYHQDVSLCTNYFLIGIVGDGVQLDPLCTAATNRPIVSTPGRYDEEKLVE
jgi:hypothetical protein